MSLATHCIPWDAECSLCNPPRMVNPDGYWGDADSGLSVEALSRMVATGEACQDCFAQFTREHGESVSCAHCFNLRAEMDVKEAVTRARHPEVQREGWAAINRTKRERKNAK